MKKHMHIREIEHRLKGILGNIDIGQRVRKGHFLKEINKIALSDKVILDAGCGVGEYMFDLLRRYNLKELLGVEIQQQKVDLINRRIVQMGYDNAKAMCANLSTDKLPYNRFDFCFCIDVLEHIKDDSNAVANLFSSLKEKGLILIHVPNSKKTRFFKEFKFYYQYDHVRDGYTLGDLMDLLSCSGFDIINTKYTTGKWVSLVWEIEKKLEKILPRRLSQILCYPLTVLAVLIDIKRKEIPEGNGILILARKKANASN